MFGDLAPGARRGFSDGLLVIDRNGLVTLVSQSLVELTGFPVAELTGRSPSLWAPEMRSEIVRSLAQIFQGNDGPQRLILQKKDGTRVSAEGSPVFLHGAEGRGGHVLLSIRRLPVREDRERRGEGDSHRSRELKVHEAPRIVGESPVLHRCITLIERVAPTPVAVLILGETGTGKELIARAIHVSSRRKGRMVSINCAALPANLVEAELFGYEKGAFTGASGRKPGRFELAKEGTLFLDEVGELPLELQPKLLRVLQRSRFEPLGGTEMVAFTGRVLAATSVDLEEAVARGEFQAALFFRLNVFPIQVPSLRERREDIPLLAEHLALKHADALGIRLTGISDRLLEHLISREWPGNIRELESFVQRALIVGEGPVLDLSDSLLRSHELSPPPALTEERGSLLHQVERTHILRILGESGWVVEGKHGAARRLGLAPSTLRSRMKKLGIGRD